LNPKERCQLFENELNYFSNTSVRDFAIFCLGKLPEYFFHIPASASGKYHPSYALGEGGLVRHTKAAMYLCDCLFNAGIGSYYPTDVGLNYDELCDCCMLALLFHDGLKLGHIENWETVSASGEELHTVHEHPMLAAGFLGQQLLSFMEDHDINAYDVTIVEKAKAAIASHMGRYVASARSSVLLPSPAAGDWCQKLVHICDLLASRKKFDFIP